MIQSDHNSLGELQVLLVLHLKVTIPHLDHLPGLVHSQILHNYILLIIGRHQDTRLTDKVTDRKLILQLEALHGFNEYRKATFPGAISGQEDAAIGAWCHVVIEVGSQVIVADDVISYHRTGV